MHRTLPARQAHARPPRGHRAARDERTPSAPAASSPPGVPRAARFSASLVAVCATGFAALFATSACEPSSATDREKGLRELRENEAKNRRIYAAPISEWDAVGCDVCPGYCRDHDLNLIPIPELVARFRRLAADWDGVEMPAGADGWWQLAALTCIAIRHGPEGEQALLSLLDDEVAVVRFRAAWHILDFGLANEAPVRALREMDAEGGWLAFQAEIRLAIWEAEWADPDAALKMRKHRMFERP